MAIEIKHKIVAFASEQSGVGCSTLAGNLASFLARILHQEGGRVLLIDGDWRRGRISGRLMLKQQPNALDLINHFDERQSSEDARGREVSWEEDLQPFLVDYVLGPQRGAWKPFLDGENNPTTEASLHLLMASDNPDLRFQINREDIVGMLEWLSPHFRAIIINVGELSADSHLMEDWLDQSDLVWMVTDPEPTSLAALARGIVRYAQSGSGWCTQDKVQVLVNRASPSLQFNLGEEIRSTMPWLPEEQLWTIDDFHPLITRANVRGLMHTCASPSFTLQLYPLMCQVSDWRWSEEDQAMVKAAVEAESPAQEASEQALGEHEAFNSFRPANPAAARAEAVNDPDRPHSRQALFMDTNKPAPESWESLLEPDSDLPGLAVPHAPTSLPAGWRLVPTPPAIGDQLITALHHMISRLPPDAAENHGLATFYQPDAPELPVPDYGPDFVDRFLQAAQTLLPATPAPRAPAPLQSWNGGGNALSEGIPLAPPIPGGAAGGGGGRGRRAPQERRGHGRHWEVMEDGSVRIKESGLLALEQLFTLGDNMEMHGHASLAPLSQSLLPPSPQEIYGGEATSSLEPASPLSREDQPRRRKRFFSRLRRRRAREAEGEPALQPEEA